MCVCVCVWQGGGCLLASWLNRVFTVSFCAHIAVLVCVMFSMYLPSSVYRDISFVRSISYGNKRDVFFVQFKH